MVKFSARGEDDTLLIGLGLERENIQRLTAGKPISVDLSEMGLGKARVMIFFGETAVDIREVLAPMIGPKTIVNDTSGPV